MIFQSFENCPLNTPTLSSPYKIIIDNILITKGIWNRNLILYVCFYASCTMSAEVWGVTTWRLNTFKGRTKTIEKREKKYFSLVRSCNSTVASPLISALVLELVDIFFSEENVVVCHQKMCWTRRQRIFKKSNRKSYFCVINLLSRQSEISCSVFMSQLSSQLNSIFHMGHVKIGLFKEIRKAPPN